MKGEAIARVRRQQQTSYRNRTEHERTQSLRGFFARDYKRTLRYIEEIRLKEKQCKDADS